MHAAFLTKVGFQIRDVPMPEIGSNEALVRLRGIGVCGGDIGPYRSRAEGDDRLMGHEGGGELVAIGEGVRGFTIGDRVAVLGGHFAEYAAINQEDMVKLADTVEPVWSLGEPVACCVHAALRCRLAGGEKVAVVGCGFMGLICLQLARLLGAGQVTAIDPLEWRRAMALSLGADVSLAPDAKEIEEDKLTYGAMNGAYDVVIECAGNQAALDLAGYLVKQHGLLNVVGHHYSDGGRRIVYMNQWNVKAIDVVNGHVRRDDEKMAAMRRGMDWAASGKLHLEPMVSYYPLDRIQDAFEDFINRKPGLIKAVIVPDPAKGQVN